MVAQAITKNFPMSPQKMREVVRQIQGLPTAHAEAVLKVVSRKSARAVAKTLKSAVANADDLARRDNYTLKTADLMVVEAVAQTGITYKRSTPKARGSAGPIIKRRCHIKIVVSDE